MWRLCEDLSRGKQCYLRNTEWGLLPFLFLYFSVHDTDWCPKLCQHHQSTIQPLCATKTAPPMSLFDEPRVSDFQCPLLNLTDDLYVVPVSSVIKPVSVVHSCNDSGKFLDKHVTPIPIKRECVDCWKLVFLHDVCNLTFCYSIFCTSNTF